MARIDESTKHRRKERIFLIVQAHNGIRTSEIAEQTGLERRTVQNYLYELGDEGKVYREGLLWRAMTPRPSRLRPFEMSPEEAMTLYLATRLLVKQHDKRNEPAETALLKLAEVLTADVGVGQEIRQAAQELARRAAEPGYESVFRTVVRAYLYRRRLRITYKPLHGQLFETSFAPYLIEPSAIGYATYAVGHSRSAYVDAIRAYKLERITQAEMTGDEYRVPPDFPGLDILRHAWSIIAGEITERVTLRFSPPAAERVLETRWHPSQDHMPDPDRPGYLRWWVDVADTRDMRPWIRGWGAEVEVLEPEELREAFKKTAARLNRMYQNVNDTTRMLYQLLYAKTNPDQEGEVHLLLYHLIDVGQVALVLWNRVLTAGIRRRLADLLGLADDEAGRWMAFLAALHDLGKAGPAYQKKYSSAQLKRTLVEAGLGLDALGRAYDETTPHGVVSTWALMSLLPEMTGLDEPFARQIAVTLGGHHGSWPPPGAETQLDDSQFPRWGEVRRDLVRELLTVFRPSAAVTPPADLSERHAFLTILSGFVSVADWLGSRNKECFGFHEQPMITQQYAEESARTAAKALADLGWIGWYPDGQARSFAEAFAYLPGIQAPRRVQAQVIAAAQETPHPTLVILEAPTGIGKTEAALYLADCWLQQHQGRGLYVAMPTQATSNQMYDRVGRFLSHRYPDMGRLNYHLMHGQAAWQDALRKQVTLQNVGDDGQAHVVAESWFTPRKRTLLAPFGVGTVDQALMSILQTRHFFVRLFGLSHKVILFDEVHAYDAFMNTLFHRLLQWLRAVGASVIILSATLSAEARRRLVEAYSGQSLPDAAASYPAVTVASAGQPPRIIPLTPPEDVRLAIDWGVERDPAAVADYLSRILSVGGCAAVVCNTVARAQAIYRALSQARRAGTLDVAADDLILFHARFPPIWRQAIEEMVRTKFGKEHPEQRPRKAIVVATQVIEQSLDLDFDVMITDLAPIDLLIQRAGRLHRHQRAERHGHERRLHVAQPARAADGLPDFENDRFVYEPYVLLRSYLALRDRSAIQIPGDTTRLIEAVYGGDTASGRPIVDDRSEQDAPAAWAVALAEAKRCMETHRRQATLKAGEQLVLPPYNRRLLRQQLLDLDEESPDVHETFRAQTRDIDPGIVLVCLHREGGGLFLMTETGKLPVSLEEDAPWEQIRVYQQNTITVQQRAVFRHFVAQPVPPAWRRQAALRHCRPVVFEDGLHVMDATHTLQLSREFGLEIIKTEDETIDDSALLI
jgi:CRISPR-associated endonuclease/helicase Cas3